MSIFWQWIRRNWFQKQTGVFWDNGPFYMLLCAYIQVADKSTYFTPKNRCAMSHLTDTNLIELF